MSIFWNDALKKGAVLGCLMALSKIYETWVITSGGKVSGLGLMATEWIVLLVVYIWLLYRFTKRFSLRCMEEMEEPKFFPYSTGLTYVITVALLAGIIVGVCSYAFMQAISYEAYVQGTIKTVQNALTESHVPASLGKMYDQMFAEMRKAPEPTLWKTISSTAWSYLFGGTVLGLIISGIVKKNPDMNNSNSDEE